MLNVCGVDFGMFNFIVGWLRLDVFILLLFEDGKVMLFFVIFFYVEDLMVSYGCVVLVDYFVGYEGCLMCLFKSLFGMLMMDDSIEVMGQVMFFCKLFVYFIGEFKWCVECVVGYEFCCVVLGCLVFFIDEDFKVDQFVEDMFLEIVCDVGFDEIVFQYELIVVVFDYEVGISGEEFVLVVDIGGGMLDFLLVCLLFDCVKCFDCCEDIFVNGGVYIGGIDFDCVLSLVSVMLLLGLNSMLCNGKVMLLGQYFDLVSWYIINYVYMCKVWMVVMDNY